MNGEERAQLEKESLYLKLQEELGFFFSNPGLLTRCLTHISYRPGKTDQHNEVLEFLGDAVLDLAVSDLLIRRYPEKSEGDLSKMRASLVNSATLAVKAEELNLGALLRMGKGEERSGGRGKKSILAGTFEAVLGGVYSDGGYEAARRIVERYFASDIQEGKLGLEDYKTRLQEISQMLFHAPPTYTVVGEAGPDHAKRFVTEILIGGRVMGRGEGRSKKEAEQEAAREALEELRRNSEARGKS